jgi:hypothetical protein
MGRLPKVVFPLFPVGTQRSVMHSCTASSPIIKVFFKVAALQTRVRIPIEIQEICVATIILPVGKIGISQWCIWIVTITSYVGRRSLLVAVIWQIMETASWEILEDVGPAVTSCFSAVITADQAQWSGAFWRMETVFSSLVINHSTTGGELLYHVRLTIIVLNKNLSTRQGCYPWWWKLLRRWGSTREG